MRPFDFYGHSSVENVNLTNCYNDYCGGFALQGTIGTVQYITIENSSTLTIAIEAELNGDASFSHISVINYVQTLQKFGMIYLHSTNLTIDYLTIVGAKNGDAKIFESDQSSLIVKNAHIEEGNNIDGIIEESEEPENPEQSNTNPEPIDPDNTKINPEPIKPGQSQTSSTTEESSHNSQKEPDIVGSLSKKNFFIIIGVCAAVVAILIITIIIIVIRKRSDTDSSFSDDSEGPTAKPPISSPPTNFPTETISFENEDWTTRISDDDTFMPDFDDSSSDNTTEKDSSFL